MQFTDGHQNYYTYNAAGQKLNLTNYTLNAIVNVPQGTVNPAPTGAYVKTVTDYVGNIIYQNSVLNMILTPEGYIQNGVYYYYLKDHLGNNRVVVDGSGTIKERNHYYPSGMRFIESTSNSAALPFRYGGKELEAMNGLSQYDFGARRRSTGFPVWTTPDPLAEKYPQLSPYCAFANNPVNKIDPDGRDPIYAKNFWGTVKLIGDDGQSSTGSYLVRGSVARDVKSATKAGEFYTGSLAESKNVMHVPTGQKLEGVKQSFEDTKLSQKENGGHSNIGDANVTRWDEGPAAIAFTDKDGNQGAKATLQMFIENGQNTMPADASNVEMWWHTHPNTTVNGVSLGSSNPSDADYSGQKTMTNRGYTGNTFVIGVRSGTVTFFNKDGALQTVKWSDFLRMGGQGK